LIAIDRAVVFGAPLNSGVMSLFSMRTILPIVLLFAHGSAQAQEHRVVQIPDAAKPATYTVYVVNDEWERLEYGYMKVRDIEMPTRNLEPCPPGGDEALFSAVEAEAADALARLNEMDWHYDGWKERGYYVVDQSCYRASDALISFVRLRTVEREYEAAAIGLLRDDVELLLFAEADPFIVSLTLAAYDFVDHYPVVYGYRYGSPAQSYGGNFSLSFKENKRVIRYSYFEESY
jgi:hypothetical protein